MLIVAALGGNALLRRGEAAEAVAQQRNIALAAATLAPIAEQHRLVVTHGNGPQVGLLALQAEAYTEVSPYPLDVLGAETEGMIGYLLEQELRNHIPGREVASLLTMVEVAGDDPAFAAPTKFVGPVYDEARARRLADSRGWSIAPDGPHWRRVVPSPAPERIVDIAAIRLLLDANAVVVCAGGGGIPVVRDGGGALHGVEGVIDKDLSSELLAEQLSADMLLMLTDVDAVRRDYGTPDEQSIGAISVTELRGMEFAAGSMGPKVEAACRFAERAAGVAVIGALEDAAEMVSGIAGTRVLPARSG